MKKPTSAALGLILILATQGYATDWVVGPFGSGAPFNGIQAAVNAAQPGDRVLVLPGAYRAATRSSSTRPSRSSGPDPRW